MRQRGWQRPVAMLLGASLLLAVGTDWCLPGLGLVAWVLEVVSPGWVAPSWYSVVVLATAREGADVTSTVERLLAAGVRPPQVLLLNSADPPQQLADFYRTFLLQPGVRALAPAAKLRPRLASRHSAAAAAGSRRNGLQWQQQQHLAECSAIAFAARQVLGGATWGRWDAAWILMLTDDSSLRFRPGTGTALGAALRGYTGCSRGVVALEGDTPGVILGYAFHRQVLGQMEHIASAICAARAKESGAQREATGPTVESTLQQIVEEMSRTGIGVEMVPGLTYREGELGDSLQPRAMKPVASLQCPAADDMRVMVAVPTFNRPRCVSARLRLESLGLRTPMTHSACMIGGSENRRICAAPCRYVELMAESLMLTHGLRSGATPIEVHVFDDHSTEYGEEQLATWFEGATIVRNEHNVGPDENTRLIFQHFLKSDSNVVVIADSDMVYHPECVLSRSSWSINGPDKQQHNVTEIVPSGR